MMAAMPAGEDEYTVLAERVSWQRIPAGRSRSTRLGSTSGTGSTTPGTAGEHPGLGSPEQRYDRPADHQMGHRMPQEGCWRTSDPSPGGTSPRCSLKEGRANKSAIVGDPVTLPNMSLDQLETNSDSSQPERDLEQYHRSTNPAMALAEEVER